MGQYITIFDDKADRIVDNHFASKAANSCSSVKL